MSKKRLRGHKEAQIKSDAKKSPRARGKIIAAILLVSCVAAGGIFAQWSSAGKKTGFWGLFRPVPQGTPDPSKPSKEYIYAGDRLIATEEPAASPTPSGSGPTNLLANATSANSVSLVWTAPSSGTVTSYVVERSQSGTGSFTQLTSSAPSTSFTDTTAAADTAYLYRVRANLSGGGTSSNSNVELATTVMFTDDPLSVGTTVKAVHLTELRRAVGAVRVLAGLSAVTWTDASPQGVTIKAVHVQELRSNLDPALTALGFTTQSYTDAVLTGVVIKKIHIDELRQRVK